ncbi:hypothetical protein A3D77_03935 [Candidatus Gottesmanbacteria bacterium RIFCSPHIGHO2_02_FULL_39_11]|uniref:Aminoglycoside phosphotransferase domain-containing protein n=1 Tax=Candidatus Gottesmanbacteria bacterium RIFCSPHIGHO2_02_FULL_39_11 TaxID=1798382 RepID=A0A1F5ZJJ3_9BACT|nr:MAG: hypothetical protein A3D77_03935 [Candidatus Gottesmanbacteria bacterium RIFCSPHIGHO2_02_FULL_39_11]
MNSNLYIIKEYHHYPGDSRNRAKTEYEALQFLYKHSVYVVPKVFGIADNYKWIVLEYISGKKIEPAFISEEIIDQCIRFILQIQKLRNTKEASKIGSASEAVFSLNDCFNYLDKRLNALNKIEIKNSTDKECRDFIKEKFFKTYYYFSNLAKERYKKEKIRLDKKLETEDRILSPSDFGFHNSILREDGQLFFLDFEYFGWDDPAKLISDFFLQPDLPLPYIYREKAVRELKKCIDDKEGLEFRLPIYYLLFGLKWCLILLNPFIREGYEESIKKIRLYKSQKFLDHLLKEYANKIFPISLLK